MSSEIVLSTLNARYHHSAFGLRYLFANLRELKERSTIVEFTISQNSKDIVESILKLEPKIVGFGVYIWNTDETYEVVSILKKLRPELIVVLGGPEVSYETDQQKICHLADYTIKGEGDLLFYELCRSLLGGEKPAEKPSEKWISAVLPEIGYLQSPYRYYTDEDIKNRVIYVEASRGCPYKCEYCLSSLDKSVRNFPLQNFLSDMEQLIQRGARQFKFIDRTFNLSIAVSTQILQFFLDRMEHGLFLHFEMVPDRLPAELRELIKKFPKGTLQFEIGIQTWNPEVSKLVSRRQDYKKIEENFRFLAQETGVHTHADLIVGLPGETLQSFATGFDALATLSPDEIQVGILKRLKGTPIIRHDQEWGMVYQEHPPFQILQTKTLDFLTLQKMNRFSQFWDMYANSGNFQQSMKLLREKATKRSDGSYFWEFYEFVDFLSERHKQTHSVALLNLVESMWVYLRTRMHVDETVARDVLIQDYAGKVKRDIPTFLRDPNSLQGSKRKNDDRGMKTSFTPKRQQRHLAIPS